MEKVHESGYTYNDLKLDNILVGDLNQSLNSMHEVRLVDFGFAERFRDKDGNHIKEVDVQVFRSNMIFASPNQLEFKTTSRRDDLKSLCYLLVYLFKSTNVPFIARGQNLTRKQIFNFIKDVKLKLTPESMVGPKDSICYPLLNFVNEVFSLEFDSAPNY
jgi:serine/threonine protein kinase